jgi:membrane protease YdiL (CAAX protease family)
VVFGAVHLQPVEFPGLFAFALLLGYVYRRTGRLGMCITTHMAFNACGLLLVSLLN